MADRANIIWSNENLNYEDWREKNIRNWQKPNGWN